MTRTRAYTQMHRAMLDAARDFGIEPLAARIALALWERSASTRELYADLGDPNSAQIRRTLGRMYAFGLVVGTGPDGGRRRRGINTRLQLTIAGQALALRVNEICDARAAG